MILQFKKHLLSLLPDAHHKKFLLTVSAGVDSIVLLHLFQQCKFKFEVAHCNFQLRGDDSDSDQYFVQQLCKDLQVPFHTKNFRLETQANKSIQNLARNVRYQWFDSLVTKHNHDFIVTAHHANDNLETTLYRLTKGSGIKGISGIKPFNENKVRPLLPFGKEEIILYAVRNNIVWREDTSNKTDKYQRNFIRNKIIPELEKVNTNLISSYHLTSQRLQLSNQIVENHIKNLEEQHFIKKNLGETIIQKESFETDLNNPILLYELLLSKHFSFDTCKQLLETIDKSGREFHNNDRSIVLQIERDHVLIRPNTTMHKVQQELDLKNQSIKIGNNIISFEILEAHGDFQIQKTPQYAFFDAEELAHSLSIASPKEGDYFVPFGMKGKQKLSDFFINNKYSASQKSNTLLLISNEQIIWVIGKRTSNLYKIKPSTSKILKCHVEKIL